MQAMMGQDPYKSISDGFCIRIHLIHNNFRSSLKPMANNLGFFYSYEVGARGLLKLGKSIWTIKVSSPFFIDLKTMDIRN